jgi:hypothetical protein
MSVARPKADRSAISFYLNVPRQKISRANAAIRRVGDKFLRLAMRILYAFLPLFSRQRGVGEALRFLRETVN